MAAAVREGRRFERFGDDAECETCGDSTLTHLNRVKDHTLCACCLALARGRETLEIHHVPGHNQKPTIRVCANCHAELSELQRSWLHLDPTVEQRTELGWNDVALVASHRKTA